MHLPQLTDRLLDIVVKEFSIERESVSFALEIPKISDFDLTVNCFSLAKALKKNPAEVTARLAELCNAAGLSEASSTQGFLNFVAGPEIQSMIAWMEMSLSERPKTNETVIVDYVGANIGKTLHIAHICTPSIGQAIVNTGRFMGYTVIGDGHIGDWGSLFGTLVVAWNRYGNEEEFQKDAVEHLLQIYVKITADKETDPSLEELCRETFKKMTEGDQELLALWAKFTSASISVMDDVLALFHVRLDYNIGESFYEGLPLPQIWSQPALKHSMRACIDDLIARGIAVQNDDGSVGVEFAKETKIPSCMARKRDGTHGYLASDLAAIRYRGENWQPKRIIYCIDIRQQLHLRQCFDIARRALWEGTEAIEFLHAANGFISLKDGAMSTRKGKIIRLKDLISEAFERTSAILKEKNRELSAADVSAIAIGSIKYSYLSQDREKDVIFDWDKALSFEGNSGPYVQYACVRARALAAKVTSADSPLTAHYSLLTVSLSRDDIALALRLSRFTEAVEDTWKMAKPHILALYAYDLAQTFNAWYVHTPSLTDEKDTELKTYRTQLAQKTGDTIEKAFELLAIPVPDRM